MFDIGFFELLLVGIVGLVVVGPERLPDAVRTTVRWWNQLKYTLTSAKDELEREVGADEIRRELHNERVLRELKESQEEMERSFKQAEAKLQQDLTQVSEQLEDAHAPHDQATGQRLQAEAYLPEQEQPQDLAEEYLPEDDEDDSDLEDPEYPEHLHDHGDPELNPHHPEHFREEELLDGEQLPEQQPDTQPQGGEPGVDAEQSEGKRS